MKSNVENRHYFLCMDVDSTIDLDLSPQQAVKRDNNKKSISSTLKAHDFAL